MEMNKKRWLQFDIFVRVYNEFFFILFRKKRSVDCEVIPNDDFSELDEAVLATYSIMRAALNSIDVDGDCVDRFMCEGGREVGGRGEGGKLLVEMGGELLGSRRQRALIHGYEGVDCRRKFPGCGTLPQHYRVPGVSDWGAYTDPKNIVDMVRDAVETKFRKKR